jgi:hypothetical protein
MLKALGCLAECGCLAARGRLAGVQVPDGVRMAGPCQHLEAREYLACGCLETCG